MPPRGDEPGKTKQFTVSPFKVTSTNRVEEGTRQAPLDIRADLGRTKATRDKRRCASHQKGLFVQNGAPLETREAHKTKKYRRREKARAGAPRFQDGPERNTATEKIPLFGD